MKICSNCGSQNENDALYCDNCGQPLENKNVAPMKTCPRCNTANKVEDQFCNNCGFKFNPKAQDTNKVAAPIVRNEITEKRAKNNQPMKIVLGIILLVIIVGGGYLIAGKLAHKDSVPKKETTTAVSSSKEKKTSEKTQSSENSLVLNKVKIKNDIATYMDDVDGKNSVYVSLTDDSAPVVENNHAQGSASMIKLFILITAYSMEKEGTINLKDSYVLSESDKVGGTGSIQNMSAGTRLSYKELLEKMIDDSDNTAANIVIDKLGGFASINTEIKKLGAINTTIKRKMMDTDALNSGIDNKTSVTDMGKILKKMYNHKLVSNQSDQAMLDLLKENKNLTKLPSSLPTGVTVYNKTGEYNEYGIQNDAAIIEKDKKAFIVVAMSESGTEDKQIPGMNRLGLELYQDILE